MKTRVEFTVDVPLGQLPALREAAACGDIPGIREFLRYEAETYLVEYLLGLGVHCSSTNTKDYPAAWRE